MVKLENKSDGVGAQLGSAAVRQVASGFTQKTELKNGNPGKVGQCIRSDIEEAGAYICAQLDQHEHYLSPQKRPPIPAHS